MKTKLDDDAKKIQDRILRQFKGATATREGGTVMVHLDKPSKTVKARRAKEVRAGGPTEDDCPLCLAIRASGYRPAVVVYDGDAVLCFGIDPKTGGSMNSGFSRARP